MLIINNKEFAKHKQLINKTINFDEFQRLKDLFTDENLDGEVSFSMQGDLDSANRPILNVLIYGKITTLCQNCLEPMVIPIKYNAVLPIFDNEEELDNLLFGEESLESDGLLFDLEFDVLSFIEDEIITILPLAPKHDSCVQIFYKDKTSNPFGELKS
ncbi:MAG TPA: hypothetical protein PKD00_03570 [Burkholderiales bacterium]|nr:hypothetical protein [Burkholderiales bacterium]